MKQHRHTTIDHPRDLGFSLGKRKRGGEGRGWEIDLEVASKKPRHHCCDHYRWSRVFDEPEPPS
jgi:hypothetical protein